MSGYNMNLCMGCMRPIDKGAVKCPECGYKAETKNDAAYLQTGTVLSSRYLIGKMLRFSGESAEYIGYDTKNSTRVTIKEYMPDTLCGRSGNGTSMSVDHECVAAYKAFMSEFVELNKSLAKMRTLAHINPPVDMFGENNTGYVIFKYVDGVNLKRYFMQSDDIMSWNDTKDIFSPLFTTLSLIHNAGIIHGGVSPENIIINENGDLFLIGFCIADARTAGTKLSAELYPGYSAPEQYGTNTRQGTHTDVYGICALLYRILTGVVPIPAPERVMNDRLEPPHLLNRNIPVNVSNVIMKGLEISGSKRIQTITELVTGLFEDNYEMRERSTRSVQDTADHRQQTRKKKAKKKQYRTAAIAALASLAFVILMGYIVMNLDDRSSNGLTGMNTTTQATTSDTLEASETSVYEEKITELSTLPTLAVVESDIRTEKDSSSVTSSRNNSTVYIMNDLTGKDYELIRNTSVIENLNIIPDYVYTSEYPKGEIFAQSIEKGDNYSKGDECIVSISMGPSKVPVPEFTGLNKRSYFEILNTNGIKYEECYYETSSVLSGYVCDTSIAPGDTIDLEAGEVLKVYIAYVSTPVQTEPVETAVSIPPDNTEPAPAQEITDPEFEEPDWQEPLPPSPDPAFTFEDIF